MYTGSLHSEITHSATVQSYNGAELEDLGPHSCGHCSVSAVMWSPFGCLATTSQFYLQHPMIMWSSFATSTACLWQAKWMGKPSRDQKMVIIWHLMTVRDSPNSDCNCHCKTAHSYVANLYDLCTLEGWGNNWRWKIT